MEKKVVSSNCSVDYAITITLSSKERRSMKKSIEQIDYMESKIATINQNGMFTISLIAEAHQDYTMHFHGYIRVNNLHKYTISYLKDLKRKIYEQFRQWDFGHIYVKDITDEPKWHEYVTKNIKTTYEIIRNPIVADELNKFDRELSWIQFRIEGKQE